MSILKFGKDLPTFTKRFRLEEGWSQSQMAKLLGIDPQYISNIERGVQRGGISFATKLLTICPDERTPFLIDLMMEESQQKMINAKRKLARNKVIKKRRR